MVYVFLNTLIVANKGSLGPYAVSDLFLSQTWNSAKATSPDATSGAFLLSGGEFLLRKLAHFWNFCNLATVSKAGLFVYPTWGSTITPQCAYCK